MIRDAWQVRFIPEGLDVTIRPGDPGYGLGVEVISPWKWSWAFESDRLPSPLAPVTFQGRLWLASAEPLRLVRLQEGTQFRALLERPTDDGPILYIGGTYRVSDLDAESSPAGVFLDVTALDALASLRAMTIGDTPWPAENRVARVGRIGRAAGVSISHELDPDEPAILGPIDVDAQGAAEVLERTIAVDPWDVIRPDAAGGFTIQHLSRDALTYFASFEWWTDSGGIARIRDNDAAPIADPISLRLPARLVRLGVKWRKSKENRTNRVTVTGLEDPDVEDAPTSATVEHASLVAKDGPNPLSIDTYLVDLDDMAATAALALPNVVDARPAWAVDEFELLLEDMTDQELDLVAPLLFPHAPGQGSLLQPPTVSIVGVDPRFELGPIQGRLVAGSLEVASGHVRSLLRIAPSVPRSLYETATWADWRASSDLQDVTWADVDPAVTWAAARSARIVPDPDNPYYPSPVVLPSATLFPVGV